MYLFGTALGVILVFQLVLYLVGDWVLLMLSVLFLLGLAWTSKQALPQWWQQAMLLLNLGTVREGERLVYHGVPWQVHALNMYTRLVNPALAGGDLLLPLRDVFALHSRPFDPAEPWFPTQQGEWVLLADQTLAQVVLQTPEVVRLVLLGGSTRTFRTPDFLAQSFTVLSAGFRLGVSFGLDAQNQALITREIPTRLEARLRAVLTQEGSGQDLVRLQVEFGDVGAASLNLRVMVDCAGTAAPRYEVLRRAIQRSCVEACTDYGWAMPFPQLTLAMAAASGQTPLPRYDGPPEEGKGGTHAPGAGPGRADWGRLGGSNRSAFLPRLDR